MIVDKDWQGFGDFLMWIDWPTGDRSCCDHSPALRMATGAQPVSALRVLEDLAPLEEMRCLNHLRKASAYSPMKRLFPSGCYKGRTRDRPWLSIIDRG